MKHATELKFQVLSSAAVQNAGKYSFQLEGVIYCQRCTYQHRLEDISTKQSA